MKTLHAVVMLVWSCAGFAADDPPSLRSYGGQAFPKPYSPPCVERENVFEFTEKPKVKDLGNDKYEITFAVKGNCDVTVGIVDADGKVVRHLGSGVLGANAPAPFQKNSLKQTIYWNGKDDLSVYHKTPETLKVRVMLGLKPEFDKLLLGGSPYNLPGHLWGIVVGPDGGYVFSKVYHLSARKFDRDGNYVMSLTPPPADMPEAKLQGMGFVEYAQDTRAVHGPDTYQTVARNGWLLPVGNDAREARFCSPVVIGTRLYYAGQVEGDIWSGPIRLNYLNTDGSATQDGIKGAVLAARGHGHLTSINLAAAPDGKTFYATCTVNREAAPTVCRMIPGSGKPGSPFIGDGKAPGSDNAHFSQPRGLDCDGEGRLYVCDQNNNRIQVFSPEGQHLKTIPVDRPIIVKLHRKTGGMYVLHMARIEGKTIQRFSKFRSFQDPGEAYHVDNLGGHQLAVDEWSAKPRLWVGGVACPAEVGDYLPGSVRIFEEDGDKLVKLADFDERAKKDEGENYIGRWGGMGDTGESKVNCDPVREIVYFGLGTRFDLRTGKRLGSVKYPGSTDDIAFDKRGYLHAHFNPGFFDPGGVARFNPDPPRPDGKMPEVPYDYGEEINNLLGVIPVRDQPGAKFFQDGIGVNMWGDVAENCNIYYVPKMEEEGWGLLSEGMKEKQDFKDGNMSYAIYMRGIADRQKRGLTVYSVRRQPGIPLLGGTIWTFERNGELRQELAVNAGDLINGVQLDEDGAVYFVTARPRMYGDRDFFLKGKAGQFGAGKPTGHPFTGTLIKTKPKAQCRILLAKSPIPMEPLPARPPELMGVDYMEETYMNKNSWCWVEGAEWLYAGASPIVSGGCSCPTQRAHLDWYKRIFVPEAYRHSFGILDTAGNLIMHLGRYGNYDSGFGAKSKIPIGGDSIAVFIPRFISGTDNCLVFSDWGERVAVLKIAYHAEESVRISNQ